MSTLNQTVKKLKSFDVEKGLLIILKKESNFITDLNTDQLGQDGIDSLGKSLGEYRPFTIDKKRNKSGLSGITSHVTLFDEGDFHRSFFVDASSFPVEIDARDPKRDELGDKYGEDIIGLTDESQSELNEVILPDVQELYRKGLGI